MVRINSIGISALNDLGDESFVLSNGTMNWGTRYTSGSAGQLGSGDAVLGDPDGFHLMYDASAASMLLGKATEENIVLSATGIEFKSNTTVTAKLDGTTLTLGQTGGTNNNIVITPTSLEIRYGSTPKISLDSSGNASFSGAITASSGSITGTLTVGASGMVSIDSGNTVISSSGIKLAPGLSDGTGSRAIQFWSSAAEALAGTGNVMSYISATTAAGNHNLYLRSSGGTTASIKIQAATGGGGNAQIFLQDNVVSSAIEMSASTITFNGSSIWHAGNDGAGSGLDADLLDSYSEAAFGRLARASTWTTLQTFSAGLTVSAGTLAGVSATLSGTLAVTGAITENGNQVWHTGNDGTGSGLAADLLDGQHAIAFANATHTHDFGDITGNGNISTTGTITANSGSDSINTIGRAKISGNAGTLNISQASASQYAFAQNSAGGTFVNAVTGNTVVLRVADSTVATIANTGVSVTGTLSASGAATMSSTLAVTGAATLSNTLAVTGITTLTGGLRVAGDPGAGSTGQISFTNVGSFGANNSGVGSIKMKGPTARDSAGFIKVWYEGTAYYVPAWAVITG